MPKFISQRDFDFFQHINRELSDEIVETDVVLYKLNLTYTNTNIYGESMEKVHATGIEISCFIDYPDNVSIVQDGFGIDQIQNPIFSFVRDILKEHDVYPEIGDIISYNNAYFEIDNIRQVELIGSRPEYSNSIICESHLTRRSNLELEPRQI